jgi:ribosome-associated protein
MSTPLIINDKITLPASDLEWMALSGPGGQSGSKIELTFDFESSVALPDSAKARLRELAKDQLDGEGRVCIRSDKTRDAMKNLADAREKLRELVLEALGAPKPKGRAQAAGAKKEAGAKKAGAAKKKAAAKKSAAEPRKKAAAKTKKAAGKPKKEAAAKKKGSAKKKARRR